MLNNGQDRLFHDSFWHQCKSLIIDIILILIGTSYFGQLNGHHIKKKLRVIFSSHFSYMHACSKLFLVVIPSVEIYKIQDSRFEMLIVTHLLYK